VIVEQGEIRLERYGRTLPVAPGYDEATMPEICKSFEANYTIQFANYPVDERYMAHGSTTVPCRG
jgi:formylmethanofuran dehydrogenase subunit A